MHLGRLHPGLLLWPFASQSFGSLFKFSNIKASSRLCHGIQNLQALHDLMCHLQADSHASSRNIWQSPCLCAMFSIPFHETRAICLQTCFNGWSHLLVDLKPDDIINLCMQPIFAHIPRLQGNFLRPAIGVHFDNCFCLANGLLSAPRHVILRLNGILLRYVTSCHHRQSALCAGIHAI